MYFNKITLRELRSFLILWLTQSFSALGSAMTGFALIIWSYQAKGSALTTALLSVCSYGPYVLMSIFAGAISDRLNRKVVMLVCDTFAALSTVVTMVLLRGGHLEIWHLYLLNALNGLMNTVQQPASDVATTLLIPRKYYQMASGMRSFSNSLVNILTPALATAILTLLGLEAVMLFDLITFAVAFLALLLWVDIPTVAETGEQREPVLQAARAGLRYLWQNRGILDLIFFLAAINLTASVYNAAFPALILSVPGGGETALGTVNAVIGVAMLLGSVLASAAPAPKSRVRVIWNALLLSNGKFLPGLWPVFACVVCGRRTGLGGHSRNERQHGCTVSQPHPSDHAGPGVCCPEYPPVFYHSLGLCLGRLAGGPGV